MSQVVSEDNLFQKKEYGSPKIEHFQNQVCPRNIVKRVSSKFFAGEKKLPVLSLRKQTIDQRQCPLQSFNLSCSSYAPSSMHIELSFGNMFVYHARLDNYAANADQEAIFLVLDGKKLNSELASFLLNSHKERSPVYGFNINQILGNSPDSNSAERALKIIHEVNLKWVLRSL